MTPYRKQCTNSLGTSGNVFPDQLTEPGPGGLFGFRHQNRPSIWACFGGSRKKGAIFGKFHTSF